MKHLFVFAIVSLILVCFGPSTSARAQSGRGGLDFGVLETGVLPGGAEIPDLVGDTLDPEVESRQPARSKALPPPDDLFDASSRTPAKKRR